MKRAFQMRFLKEAGLRPEHYLFDIGCGTLRGGIPLIEYLEPGHYYGVELRADVLREGRKELKEAGLTSRVPVLMTAARLNELEVETSFDYVWGFSVLIHMTDEALDDCLSLVRRVLKPDGVFLANVKIGEEAEGSWQGFPVVSRPLSFYEKMARRHGLDVSDLGSLASLDHITGIESQDRQRMLKFRLGAQPVT